MPFTPTHILAVLPINLGSRNSLPLSALAIGSMTPDAPLFFPLISPGYQESHATLGPILACLPFAIPTFLLFQFVMKEPLIGLCPTFLRDRMSSISKPHIQPTIVFFVLATLAIVLGAYSHIFWDSFTHRHRWGTDLFPGLSQTYPILGRKVPAFSILQHGSSVIGLPIILVAALLWLKQQPSKNDQLEPIFIANNPAHWIAVGFILAATAQAAYQFGFDTSLTLEVRASHTVTRSMMTLTLAAIAYSTVVQFRFYWYNVMNAKSAGSEVNN